MSPTKIKKLAKQVPQNDTELNKLLTDIVTAQTTKETAVAARDSALAKFRETLEAEHGYDAEIKTQETEIARQLELLETWSAIHHKRFGDARSITLNGHRFGHRLGQWKTTATEKWETVVAKLQKWIDAGQAKDATDEAQQRAEIAEDYLVFKVTPNREAMLRDRDIKDRRALLEKAGVEFDQDESFFLDPNREGQQPARLES